MPVFKIHDQANDGNTIALRISNVRELRRLATHYVRPSMGRLWASLNDFIVANDNAQAPILPYSRQIEVLWDIDGFGLQRTSFCQDRTLVATYSGILRINGGFSTQCYVVLDPAWNNRLRPFIGQRVNGQFLQGDRWDLLVIR